MAATCIRPAEDGDFDVVAALLEELGRPEVTAGTREGALRRYRRYLAREDAAPLVAESDGEVIGSMSLEFRDRLNRPTPQAWIPDLIVTPRRRGLGAGRALLLRGVELAAERGCWGVTLESGYARTAAHQLYRAAGMVDEGLFFTLLLPAEQEQGDRDG